MPWLRGNDSEFVTEVLTGADGNPITGGIDVDAELLTEDGITELIAKGAMTHDAGGVWRRPVQGEVLDGLVVPTGYAKTKVTVGDPPDATFVRVDEVVERRS